MFKAKTQKRLMQLADGFGEGTCLLNSTEWLSENDVTLDECISLSEIIGNAIRVASQLDARTYGYLLGKSLIESPPQEVTA